MNALKQLAGNSGYHFQLLTAVIEVNESRSAASLASSSGIWGRCAAAGSRSSGWRSSSATDDMREASSCPGPPPQSWEGADAVGYDPVAMGNARAAPGEGVELADSLLAS